MPPSWASAPASSGGASARMTGSSWRRICRGIWTGLMRRHRPRRRPGRAPRSGAGRRRGRSRRPSSGARAASPHRRGCRRSPGRGRGSGSSRRVCSRPCARSSRLVQQSALADVLRVGVLTVASTGSSPSTEPGIAAAAEHTAISATCSPATSTGGWSRPWTAAGPRSPAGAWAARSSTLCWCAGRCGCADSARRHPHPAPRRRPSRGWTERGVDGLDGWVALVDGRIVHGVRPGRMLEPVVQAEALHPALAQHPYRPDRAHHEEAPTTWSTYCSATSVAGPARMTPVPSGSA